MRLTGPSLAAPSFPNLPELIVHHLPFFVELFILAKYNGNVKLRQRRISFGQAHKSKSHHHHFLPYFQRFCSIYLSLCRRCIHRLANRFGRHCDFLDRVRNFKFDRVFWAQKMTGREGPGWTGAPSFSSRLYHIYSFFKQGSKLVFANKNSFSPSAPEKGGSIECRRPVRFPSTKLHCSILYPKTGAALLQLLLSIHSFPRPTSRERHICVAGRFSCLVIELHAALEYTKTKAKGSMTPWNIQKRT